MNNNNSIGLTVWFTGLSGAGKTTICNAVSAELLELGYKVHVLDGDVIRSKLNSDLGFSRKDRDENIRRLGFIASLLSQHGIIVLVAAISPYRAAREELRRTLPNFIEVYVNAPLAVCEQRDPKRLYQRARKKEIRGFTGIDDPYQPPLYPEVECNTDVETLECSTDKVVSAVLAFFDSGLNTAQEQYVCVGANGNSAALEGLQGLTASLEASIAGSGASIAADHFSGYSGSGVAVETSSGHEASSRVETSSSRVTSSSRQPTIAVDFDGVLADYDGWKGAENLGQPRLDVIRVLNILRDEGWKIIVHTTRSEVHITDYLLKYEVPYDEINRNSSYQNLGSKPVATIYWDDRAMYYSGDAFRDLEAIRRFRTWNGRS